MYPICKGILWMANTAGFYHCYFTHNTSGGIPIFLLPLYPCLINFYLIRQLKLLNLVIFFFLFAPIFLLLLFFNLSAWNGVFWGVGLTIQFPCLYIASLPLCLNRKAQLLALPSLLYRLRRRISIRILCLKFRAIRKPYTRFVQMFLFCINFI